MNSPYLKKKGKVKRELDWYLKILDRAEKGDV